MRFFHFFVSHSIFISCCAVGLCVETCLLFGLPILYPILGFVFFSTLCSYNFYWLLSKFSSNKNFSLLKKNNITNLSMFFLGALGCVYFFFKANLLIEYVAISILLTMLYSMPLWPFSFSKKIQQLGFVKTILLAFTWAFVTVLFPFYTTSIFGQVVLIFFIKRFLFMLLLCIIFDKREILVDKMQGLETLVTKMNQNKINKLYYSLLGVYFYFNVYFLLFNISNLYFIPSILISFILLFAYIKSLKPQGYLFYYFFIDGLMLVSFFTNCVANFIVYGRNPF